MNEEGQYIKRHGNDLGSLLVVDVAKRTIEISRMKW